MLMTVVNQQTENLLIGLSNKLSSGIYQDVYNGLDINWDNPRSIQQAAKEFSTITKSDSTLVPTRNIYKFGKCCK